MGPGTMKMVEGQLTIGDLLEKLQKAPPAALVSLPGMDRGFSSVVSYRGYYDQPALVVQWDSVTTDVLELTATLQVAIEPNTRLHGWKGGEYQMTRQSPLWVVESAGTASGWGVVDLKIVNNFETVLMLRHEDDA